MRASRLLRILLILQNRGRVTSLQLADELEVSRRTVLRDLDALAEAGLPIVTHRGSEGGVELGFNYRSRFVGLDGDEAEALGVILGMPMPGLRALGMEAAAHRACDKLVDSLPDQVRQRMRLAQRRFQVGAADATAADPRVAALADATRKSVSVRLQSDSAASRTIHPIALMVGPDGWAVVDELDPGRPIPERLWGAVHVSGRQFASP